MKKTAWILLTLGLVVGTQSAVAQAPFRQQTQPAHSDGIDPQILMKSKDVLKLSQEKKALIVDVRSRFEYNTEHIQNAISYPFRVISESQKFPFPKNRNLIMYCGCPHHLSGLSAKALLKSGYKNVKVIDEGYHFWKEKGYPTVQGKPPEQKISKKIQGQIRLASKEPAAYQDIFLLHPPTGQLEATRTDALGQFKMTLHFANVSEKDNLQFKLNKSLVKQVTLNDLNTPQSLFVRDKLAWLSD